MGRDKLNHSAPVRALGTMISKRMSGCRLAIREQPRKLKPSERMRFEVAGVAAECGGVRRSAAAYSVLWDAVAAGP